jgi:aldose 1-epimerase
MSRPFSSSADDADGALTRRHAAGVQRERFAVAPNGRPVDRFTLTNAQGTEVRFLTYGGAVQAVSVPDRRGASADVALGYDALDDYTADRFYIGPLIGRFANRIARGRFTLDGRTYTLATNDGPNHLHGGTRGFHKVHWEADPFHDDTGVGAVLHYVSPAAEEGYPGALSVLAR